MKTKQLLVVGLFILASITGWCQKPDSTGCSLEAQLNLSGTTVTAPEVKFRYFFMPNMAARIGINFSSGSTESAVVETSSGESGSWTVSSNTITINPGVEYHFDGTDKLSPYVGLVGTFGMGNTTTSGENTDGSNYIGDYTEESEAPVKVVGVSILAGADFYFAKNVFLGAELGWGWNKVTAEETTTTITSGGDTEEITSPGSTSSSSGVGSVGGIRIGWRF